LASSADLTQVVNTDDRLDDRALLKLADVTVRHPGGVVALSNITLQVGAGERVAIVGQSGAGKSTLLGLCNATVVASSGSVTVLGNEVCDDPKWRRLHGSSVAMIPQQLQLVGRLQVIHNVNAAMLGTWSAPKALRSLIRPLEVDVVESVLRRVGIADKIRQRADQLSGGEQQRVAIARALRQRPRLLLADEPTASLDPARARDVMTLLARLASEDGSALIVSQHDVDLALETCDRIIGLRHGQVMFDCLTSEVSSAELHDLYAVASMMHR
jgi:phosphonate transport system ATP-binding protein